MSHTTRPLASRSSSARLARSSPRLRVLEILAVLDRQLLGSAASAARVCSLASTTRSLALRTTI